MTTHDRADPDRSPCFDATLTLVRRPWTAGEVRRQILRHPWMTAKVIGAIHWEALRLWRKGLPHYPVPDGARRRDGPKPEAST
jgi:DUF1365 family protein